MTEDKDPFYVGYLPLPPVKGPYVKVFIVTALIGVIVLAFILASRQRDPGAGHLDSTKTLAIEGHLSVNPYPVVYIVDPASPTKARAVLLVSTFKFGALDRVRAWNGKRVRALGHFISRDGRSMFELLDGDDAVSVVNKSSSAPKIEDLGTHTLVGEVTDSKCFLGMMKPGVGKTHRACAVRCISGGVPPVFVTRDEDGTATIYLLTDRAGAAVGEDVLPYVAEPVQLEGHLQRRGDLLFFSIDPSQILRR